MTKGSKFRIFGKTHTMKSHVLIIGLFFQFLCISLFPQEFSTLGEIYDFDSEDEFQHIRYNCCNEVFFQLLDVKILERNETQESIQYIRNTSLFSFVFANPPILVDTFRLNIIDTIIILNPDSIIFTNGDEIISNTNIYNGRKTCIKHSEVMGKPKVEKFVNGCGLAVTKWYSAGDSSCRISDSLVYFKKEKEEWGINRFLSINEKRAIPGILIYPNPTCYTLNIKPQTPNKLSQIRIYNLSGKQLLATIKDQNKEIYQIDLSHFKKGVYLLHIKTVDKNQVYRIIKF